MGKFAKTREPSSALTRWSSASASWTVVMFSFLFGLAPLGAQSYEGTINGIPVASATSHRPLRTNLPAIPERPRRPLGGQVMIPPESHVPVESFIESLKGNDAAFRVVLGQGRLLTLRENVAKSSKPRAKNQQLDLRITDENGEIEDESAEEAQDADLEDSSGAIAVGDPSIADFQLLPNPRLVRILGLRPGVTDLSVTTADGDTVSLEVHVEYDIPLLEARLRQLFPAARIKIGQLREHLIVEGQVRSASQAARVLETVEAFLESEQVQVDQQGSNNSFFSGVSQSDRSSRAGEADQAPIPTGIESGGLDSVQAQVAEARVINLLRVPGVHQVLLKVRIAELNRTALREVGADILGVSPQSGNIVGTRIGGASISASGMANPITNQGMAALGGLLGSATGELGTSSSAFGIFPSGDFQIILRALRQNGFLRILAEPNLVTMSGHRASFLAGGEFPVPVPQSGGGAANAVTVDFREFGVRLDFLPYLVEEDRIRLSVTPEVSTIDRTLGTTLVVGGDAVPGLNTRRANTTVELRPGQTLALAGLLQVELDGQTSRIPGLGDLPYLGPLFSNTTHRRVEKEMVVLVTPELVKPIEDGEMLAMPGDGIEDPTDFELYIENQHEGRTGVNHRSTIEYGWCRAKRLIHLEKRLIPGAVGFGN